jgi:hypothetical protein
MIAEGEGMTRQDVRERRAATLVSSILRLPKELQLDDKQLAAIHQLFSSRSETATADRFAEQLIGVLTEGQLRFVTERLINAAGYSDDPFATPLISPEAKAASTTTDEVKVGEAVELQVAINAGERLVGWLKTVGFLVGLPVTAFLLGVSAFGINKFEDIRNAARQADTVLMQAKANLAETQGYIRLTYQRAGDSRHWRDRSASF